MRMNKKLKNVLAFGLATSFVLTSTMGVSATGDAVSYDDVTSYAATGDAVSNNDTTSYAATGDVVSNDNVTSYVATDGSVENPTPEPEVKKTAHVHLL